MRKWKLAGKQVSSKQQRRAQRLGLTWSPPPSLLSCVASESQFWPVCSYRLTLGWCSWMAGPCLGWPLRQREQCTGVLLLPILQPPEPWVSAGDGPWADPVCAMCPLGPLYCQKFFLGAEVFGWLCALADSSATESGCVLPRFHHFMVSFCQQHGSESGLIWL